MKPKLCIINKEAGSGFSGVHRDLADPKTRRDLTPAALRAFFAIAEKWALSGNEQRILLGSPSESTFYNWKSEKSAVLSYDQLERISLILGIYKAVHLIFVEPQIADDWMRHKNKGLVFGGVSPLAKMCQGSVNDLFAVRRYLDAWRGG